MSDKQTSGTGASADDKKNPMTLDAAARIQALEAKAGDGGVKAGDFAARAQAAAANNENQGVTGHAGGKK